MKEITKKAIRFTDVEENIEREEMLEDLYLADTALVNLGSSEEPKYKLKHRIRFSSMGIYEVSKEDYDWCVDYLNRKASKNKKTPQSDKIGTFKMDEVGNLVWEDSTYGHTVFTTQQVEAIKFLINNELR
jgi:hypothetical protein